MRCRNYFLIPLALFGISLPLYSLDSAAKPQEGYTINYNTLSIVEYIKFASKICNVNFIFNEQDLDFTVTIVSEEPATSESVMSTLIQVLRIHGLLLLEQDKNNLVIHKSDDVKQLAMLVSGAPGEQSAPIVTRIFRIKNSSPTSIATIIRSMISKSAILEVSAETRQLILTDITSNVDKVAQLIDNLDSPQALLDIQTYQATHNSPHYLLEIGSQVMQPIAQGNPFILVPAELSNTIYVVSTPELAQKAIGVFSMLDTPPTTATAHKGKGATVFVYKVQDHNEKQVMQGLENIADQMEKSGAADPALIDAIDNATYVPETQSITFVGAPEAIDKIKDFLGVLGTGAPLPTETLSFFVYRPTYRTAHQIESSLKEIAYNLKETPGADAALIETIERARVNSETNTILFSGSESSFAKVKELLTTVDQGESEKAKAQKPGYYIYKLQNTTGEAIEDDLDSLAKNFKESGLKDVKILDVIHSMRYIKETNSLLLTGDPKAIEEVKDLIAKYDYPRTALQGPANSNFYMYKPQHMTAQTLQKALSDVADNLNEAKLADPSLLSAIQSAKYVDTTNSIIFTGTPDALAKIQSLIQDIDTLQTNHAPIQHIGKTTFLLYKLQRASGPQLIVSLKAITTDLKKSGSEDKDLVAALNSVRYIRETHSLLFTGTQDALARVQTLVEQFDIAGPSAAAALAALPVSVSPGAPNFFVYKPQVLTGPELEKLMQEFADNLKAAGLADPDLFNSISSMRWVDATQSLLFTGTQKSLDQVRELLHDFDVSPANQPMAVEVTPEANATIQSVDNTSFLVYKLQFHKGDEIQTAMRQIAKDLLVVSAPINQNLLNSINSVQWLEVTNSLLCTGDQETLTRLRELVKNLDIPLRQVFIEMLVVQTSLANALTFGLEWGGDYKYRTKFAGNLNNTVPPNSNANSTSDPLLTTLNSVLPFGSSTTPPTPAPGNIAQLGSGFDLGIVGQVIKHHGNTYLNLSSLMAALQYDNESTIVMTPKIITQDGRTSSIFSGQNIPFAGSFVSQTGSNNTGTTNIEYRDIGVNLTITPVLGNSDIVTLDITLDQTSVPATAQATQITFNQNGYPNAINGITSSKTSMQTTVHIPDNHFLILSGMVNNSTSRTKTGIPCLGGLPVIGAAFSQDNDTISNTNIVIFLRPHILSSLEDMTAMTRSQEEFFRDQAGTPKLQRAYDESLELLKTIDDE